MTQKKYTISLDGLPEHENIIFKLICSVSERTKNRTNAYVLTAAGNKTDVNIFDIKNKVLNEQLTADSLDIWVSDKQENIEQSIARPLIASRVLHTLDNLIGNKEPISAEKDKENISHTESAIEFNITEEEASELAIVHDEILENPANQDEIVTARNVELTLVKNEQLQNKNSSEIQRVLVVDDSPSVRKQLEIELELFNVTIDFAECAQTAFDLLESNTYDLALLDVVLPDKDGFQICKHIKSDNKKTIAIMLTGRATQADKIKGSLAGCDAYLVKPVGRQTFQNAVKNYITLKLSNSAIKANI